MSTKPLDLTLIERYVDAKREVKKQSETIAGLKHLFYAACESISKGADLIEIKNVVIYKRLNPEYNYSGKIKKLERELNTLKKAYQQKHNPINYEISWNVRFESEKVN